MASKEAPQLRLPAVNRRSTVHCPPGPWPTVLAFLCERFPKQGEAAWRERLARGDVRTQAGDAIDLDATYLPNRLLTYERDVPNESDRGLRATVLFETEHLLIADKPHFMPVTPGGDVLEGSMLRQLQRATGCVSLQPLHRIDAETAGLVAFAKRVEDRAAYQALFRDRQVTKRYLAASRLGLIPPQSFERSSRIEPDPQHFMRMREVSGEPNAHSRATLLSVDEGAATWLLEPVSGKRHQLRVHMHAQGHALLNDRIYPELLPARDRSAPLPEPLQLLAAGLSFLDPLSGERVHCSSGLRLLHRSQ